jgi:hypothetical protein
VRGKKEGTLGQIRNVSFRDITCRSENGILIYGTPESIPENLRFENIRLKLVNSPLNGVAGGNIDLRGCLDRENSLFSHDIPGLYAQNIRNLVINDFSLEWENIPFEWFTNGIEVNNFRTLRINDFEGKGAPGNNAAVPVFLNDGRDFGGNVPSEKIKRIRVIK